MKKIYFALGSLITMSMNAQVFEDVTTDVMKGFYYSSFATGDVNNNGFKDVFFTGAIDSNDDGNVDFTQNEFYKNTNGAFSLGQTFTENAVHLSDVKFIDFDNDGLLDVVTAGLSYNDVVNYKQYRYRNTGSSFELVDSKAGKIFGNMDVFDFNNDGKLDYAINGAQYIAGTGFTQNVDLNINTGNGFETTEAWIPGTQNGNFKVLDINNDNQLDVLVLGLNADNELIFNVYKNNNGTLELSQELKPIYDGEMAYADFNGDGFLDVVVSGLDSDYNAYLGVLMNDGTGTFTLKEIEGEGLGSASLDVGDLNNDGHYDFIVQGDDDDYNGFVKIFLYNPETGDFTKAENTEIYNLGSGGKVELFDFNNDNQLDVLSNGFDWEDEDYRAFTKLYKNTSTVVNAKPNAPTTLTATDYGNSIVFDWSGASDDKTSENSLQYELSVGSAEGKSDIAKYTVTTKNWFLKKAGLPSNLFWSVKSIDASKVFSDKSEEKTISILSVSDVKKGNIALYPIPVTDVLNLKSDIKVMDFKLYNLSGQVVQSQSQSHTSYDLSSLPKGVYIAEITLQNGERISRKIIKN